MTHKTMELFLHFLTLTRRTSIEFLKKVKTCEVSWRLGKILTGQVGCTLNYSTRTPYIDPYFTLLQPPPSVFSLPPVAVRTHAALDLLPPPFGLNPKVALSLLGSPSLQTVATFLQQDVVGPNLLDT